jgi:hypothetical protein
MCNDVVIQDDHVKGIFLHMLYHTQSVEQIPLE